MTLVRVEETPQGQVHHTLHLAALAHRGAANHLALLKRSGYRRRRRAAHLRSRSPFFRNRRRTAGWLPPSLRSRVGNVLTRARRSQRWTPLTRIEVERVRFDQEAVQDPEIRGVA